MLRVSECQSVEVGASVRQSLCSDEHRSTGLPECWNASLSGHPSVGLWKLEHQSVGVSERRSAGVRASEC